MSEVSAVVAESQPAAVAPPVMEVERGPLVNLTSDERAEFRKTGDLPKPKTEDTASSPEPKPVEGEAEPAGDSEPPESKQEKTERKPKLTAEDRIAQLEATIEKIRKGAGLEKTQAESSPAKPEPKPEQTQAPVSNYAEWRKTFKPIEWIDQYAKDNPSASYEDANAAMSDYQSDMREQFKELAQKQQAHDREFFSKVDEARGRYENFDEVVRPAAEKINSDPAIEPFIKRMLNRSNHLADFLFTVGNDPAELKRFIAMAKYDPEDAAAYITLNVSLIADELASKSKPATEEPPAKPRTQAPRPPSEAGGRAASPPDAMEAAAKANDFRAFKAESLRRDLAKLKT